MSEAKITPIEILLKTYPQADRAAIAMAFASAKLSQNDPLIALMVALQSRETQAVLSPLALREVAEQALARIQAAQNETVNHLECIARRMESASGEWFNLSQPPKTKIKTKDSHPWDLNSPLSNFTDRDTWTVGDSCEGTIIFGATGGGKTSGPGQTLAKSMLREGYGGLVLCAKADEPPTWMRWAKDCGRLNDLQFFTQSSINFLDYEMKRPGLGAGLTENIVQLLMTAAEIPGGGAGGDNDYWMKATKH